jgi:hypothetical protein
VIGQESGWVGWGEMGIGKRRGLTVKGCEGGEDR